MRITTLGSSVDACGSLQDVGRDTGVVRGAEMSWVAICARKIRIAACPGIEMAYCSGPCIREGIAMKTNRIQHRLLALFPGVALMTTVACAAESDDGGVNPTGASNTSQPTGNGGETGSGGPGGGPGGESGGGTGGGGTGGGGTGGGETGSGGSGAGDTGGTGGGTGDETGGTGDETGDGTGGGAVACADTPANPDHGTYPDCAGAESGANCDLACDEGYTPSEPTICSDGSWNAPTCDGNPCVDTPVNPANGSHTDCPATPSGETCALSCDEGHSANGETTCLLGVWEVATCDQFGMLEGTVTDAVTGDAVAGGQLYIDGLFDTGADDCVASTYCAVTGAAGEYSLSSVPPGDQNVILLATGYESVDTPVHVDVGEAAVSNLVAIPDGFIDGSYVVVVTWKTPRDLDAFVGNGSACVYYGDTGNLDDAPFMALDRDDKEGTGPETIRIKKNETDDVPQADATYTLEVWDRSGDLATSMPELRLLSRDAAGVAHVQLFTLPDNVEADQGIWTPFEIAGDGTISEPNTIVPGGPDNLNCPR